MYDREIRARSRLWLARAGTRRKPSPCPVTLAARRHDVAVADLDDAVAREVAELTDQLVRGADDAEFARLVHACGDVIWKVLYAAAHPKAGE